MCHDGGHHLGGHHLGGRRLRQRTQKDAIKIRHIFMEAWLNSN